MDAPTWPELAERARTGLASVAYLRVVLTLVDDDRRSVHAVTYGEGPDGGRWRIEDERGLLVLRADGHLYRRATRRGPRLEALAGDWAPGPELGYLGWGHPALFLDPPQTPVDPDAAATAAEVAGRPAWSVRLLSAGRPLDVALDAATGLPLRVAAIGAPYVTEVTSFEEPPDLPDDVFALPAATPQPRRSATDGAAAAAELQRRGLRLPSSIPGLGDVSEWAVVDADEDTESFVAVGRSPQQGVVALARTALSHPPSRPLAAASGVSIGARAPRHVYAWHDATWSYELLTDAELDQSALTVLEV